MKKGLIFLVLLFSAAIKLSSADIESTGLAFQVVQNIYGLVNNINDNALGYKNQARTKPTSEIKTIMRQDSVQYERRIDWVINLSTSSIDKMDSSFAVFGLSTTTVIADLLTLKNIAVFTRTANLNSREDIEAEADRILQAVPKYKRLW